jgi:O-antigen ligase
MAALPWVAAGGVGLALGVYAVGVAGLDTVPDSLLPLLLVAAPGPFAALIVGDVRRLLLAAVLVDLPLQLDTHLGYRDDVASFGALVGWSVSLTTMALAGLYFLWILRTLAGVGPLVRPAIRASLPLAGFVVADALSMLAAQDVTLAAFEAFLLAQLYLLFLYVASWVRTRRDLVFVVTLLVAGLAFEGLLMLASRFAGETVRIPGLMARVDVGLPGQAIRAGGTVGGANVAAAYTSILLLATLGVLLTTLSRRHKQLALVALGLGAAALLATLSRGGLISFALGATVFCLFSIWRGWLSPVVPVGSVVVVGALVLLLQDLVLSRFVADDQGSAQARIPLMVLAMSIVDDHPLLGIGANNFALVMMQYVTPNFSEYGGDWLYVVHNKYLLIWAESGTVGLVAFLAFYVSAIWTGWRGWLLEDRLLSPLALGLMAALVGHLFHMSVDLFTDRPEWETLVMCAAVLSAIVGVARGERAGAAVVRAECQTA